MEDPEVPNQVREYSPADQRLEALFDKLEHKSLDTLESAAKQMITLTTSLLGLMFGVLALKDLPVYLKYPEVKIMAVLAVVSLLVGLLFGLDVLIPQRYKFSSANLTRKREVLEEMLAAKETSLRFATLGFGVGVLLLGLATADILLLRL